jgi:hypothetical protein
MDLQATRAQAGRALMALAACAALGLAGCGPQPLDVKTTLTFTGPQAKAALKEQMPPALLAAVGGQVPDVWPASAPRLLLDLLLTSRGRLDLKGAGVDPTKYGALRVKAVRAHSALPAGLFKPEPAEYLLFAGPAGTASLSDTGVLRIARGAFPGAPACTGACTDAGPQETTQLLELEPGARGGLQQLLQAGSLELLLVLRVPVDTAVRGQAPSGTVTTSLELDLELVP